VVEGVTGMRKNIAIITFVTTFTFLTSYADEGGGKQGISNSITKSWHSSYKNNEADAASKGADKTDSVIDKFIDPSFGIPKHPEMSLGSNGQFCDSDNTGIITVYTTNSSAQSEIDVKLDGNRIGSLKSFYPQGEPGCKAPNAAGVITINVPAGDHTIEANSPNLRWPSHPFSVKKCGCTVLPLS